MSRTVCAAVSTALRAAASHESGLTPMTSVTRYTLSLILAPLGSIPGRSGGDATIEAPSNEGDP
jgi:hypothetical protein